MSESPATQEPSVGDINAAEVTETSETAFSRFGGKEPILATRRSYGSSLQTNVSDKNATKSLSLGNVLQSADLLAVDMSQQPGGESLFATNNDESSAAKDYSPCAMNSDNEEESDKEQASSDISDDESSDADTVHYDQDLHYDHEPQASRGRTKKSFPSVLECTTGETPSPSKEQVEDTSVTEENEVDVPDKDQEDEETTNKDVTMEEVNDEKQVSESAVQETSPTKVPPKNKEQPNEDSLITSIDNLFVHADKETVTVKDITKSLEAEYDVKFKKSTKAIVRSHLKDLINGTVDPTVDSMEPASESEEEEEQEVSDAGEVFDSESSDEEEVKKAPKKKKRKQKTTKRISPRQKASKKKPSHVRIHAEMLRKKRIEELRVRNEELQVKQSKEDQKRAEQIAAKFETDTNELRLKRLEDRLDLLQKLDQKRIRVVSDEAKGEDKAPKVELTEDATAKAVPKDDEVPSSAPTEDSDSEDDFELEIIGKDEPSSSKEPDTSSTVTSSAAPAVIKSSAISMLDMVGGLKPSDKKPKRTGLINLTSNQPQASPGKSMTARAALRNSLRAKQRKGANMWLARELGYKTQEEHMRDCMLVEQKKREDVVKREEERLKANERKQLRERMLLESDPYEAEEEEEYNPDEAEETTAVANDGNESDEEMAQARQIEEEEKDVAESPEKDDVLPEASSEDTVDSPMEEAAVDSPMEKGRDLEEEKDDRDSEEMKQVERTPSGEEPPLSSDHDSLVLDDDSAAVETKAMELDDAAAEGAPPAVDVETNPDAETSPDDNVTAMEETAEPPHESEPALEGTTAEIDFTPSPEDSPASEPTVENDDHAPADNNTDDEEETEFKEGSPAKPIETAEENKAPKDKNAGWKAMLQKEAEKLKKQKAGKNGKGLVEAEADEEEEEEVAGLEDFGFSLGNKKKDDDEAEDADADKLTEEDLKHVVDDVSDDEGDEEAGELARKELEQKEEKERHKEIIRRMRDGYDGRRGGIAGGGVGARGMHRFDQLVAADNREDAKRLGLLNDDELDSDDEAKGGGNGDDEEEDENALLDKMLKDRFLHRSSLDEVEENFSSDEEEEEEVQEDKEKEAGDEDEKEQERLAKRFAKRARMQRLIETHGEDEEFSQLRLIDEDETTRLELKMMKSVSRKSRSTSTASSSRSASQSGGSDCQESTTKRTSSLSLGTSSLSLALQASRTSKKKKTSFLGGTNASKEMSSSVHKCVSMGHVVFNTGGESQLSKGGQSSRSNLGTFTQTKGKRKRSSAQQSTSLWSKVSANGFKRRRS